MDFAFQPASSGRKGAGGADAYSTSDSDSDDEGNAFRMPATDPTEAEFSEFQPRKRRRTGRDAKESAALGIFGSDSEDDHSSRRRKARKPLRRQGMSFVSSGQKKEEDDDEEDENNDIDDDESEEDGRFGMSRAAKRAVGLADDADEKAADEEDDYDDEAAAGVGLGFGGASGGGLGFVPASFQSSGHDDKPKSTTRKPPPTFQAASSSDVDARNPLGQGFVPSSAYDPTLRPHSQRTKEPAIVARPSAFSSKPAGRGGGGGSYNPKSFGARMMAKMGFVEGQGLGTEGQGRNVIIEANLRPQGVGLGAVREKSEKERQEEKRQARLRGEEVVDSEEEERKAKAAARKKKQAMMASGSGGTSGTSTPRRPKKKYMTMDEAKKAAPGLHIPEAFTPILDMTGPGRKMLTMSSGLMTPTSGAAAGTASPGTPGADETAEQAESRKLARRAQSDFMAILEEWQSLQNRKAFAELQAQQARQELVALETSLQGHKAMTSAFAQLSLQADEAWRPRWDRTIAQLQVAAEAIPPSSMADMKDTLADVSVAALHPVFKQALDAWQPLDDPYKHLVDGLQSIQALLAFGDAGQKLLADSAAYRYDTLARPPRRSKTASPYEAMVYTLWLPVVSAAVRAWDVVHNTERMLALYETWLPVLPDFVRAQLLEEVVRRLDEAVAKWEPKRRRQTASASGNLIHLWLFPWLPYLPTRHLDPSGADGLVVKVKRKFRQLIDVWEFYRGVVPGLRQWKAVLRPNTGGGRDEWRSLVMSHVLPSMARYVRAQFRVDPRDQAPYLEVVTGELQWLALLAPELVGEVLVAEVFPMWHEALHHLLTDRTTSLLQIAQWLQWWTDEVFPDELRRLPSVAAEFERGLVMVNEALDMGVTADGGYDVDRVRQYLPPRPKGPALKTTSSSRHNGHRSSHHGHHNSRHDDKTPAMSGASEELSIRHYVEDWCEKSDLQFIPERKRVHAEGRALYRITARGDGRGGVLVYFHGVRLYVETKKGPLEIRVDRSEDWEKLQQMAE